MKRVVMLMLIYFSSFCQVQWFGEPVSLKYSLPLTDVPFYSFVLDSSETIVRYDSLGRSVIGTYDKVSIDFMSESNYVNIDGHKIYRLGIRVKNAGGVGLTFKNFYLPKNVKLFVYDSSMQIIKGSFDYRNNKRSGKFAITPVKGETMILELNVYPGCSENPVLVIDKVGKFFKEDIVRKKTSNSCFVDVHCVPYMEESRGIINYYVEVKGKKKSYVVSCSGSLINQDVNSDDISPIMITANHCITGADLSTLVACFHYQLNVCNGSVNPYWDIYSVSGAQKLVNSSKITNDLALIKLDVPRIPADYNVHYLGWDIRKYSKLNKNIICMHHPALDDNFPHKKKISQGTLAMGAIFKWQVYWQKINQQKSTTYGGSSGSPLLSDFKIIGSLSGGISNCTFNGPDFYGKLRKKWKNKWKPFLSPNNNSKFIEGRDPCYKTVEIKDRILHPAVFYQPKNKVVIQAEDSVFSYGNVIVRSGSYYKFTAGKSIVLSPGFKAEKGAKFIARIEECDKHTANKMFIQYNNKNKCTSLPLDYSLADDIKIYPNPVEKYLFIEFNGNEDIMFFDIFNLLGQKVNVPYEKINKNTLKFDFGNLPQGMYIIHFYYKNNFISKIILK